MEKLVDRFFSFSGRVKRGHFCLGSLFSLVVFWITFLLRAFPRSSFHSMLSNRFAAVVPLIVAIAFALESFFVVVAAVSLLSIQVRRLHDGNFSGWWSIPIVAWQAYCFAFPTFLNDGSCGLYRLGLLALPLFVLLLVPSMSGKNHYGQEPA